MAETTPAKTATRDQKSKVSFSVFKPKTIQFDLYKDAKYLVGLFIGRATGKFERTDDRTSEIYVGVKGAFKAVIASKDTRTPQLVAAMLNTDDENSISSGIAYMPDAWLHPILDALEAAKGAGAVSPTIEFVYAVYIGRRGEQDYEWVVEDMRPVAHVDPLAAVMQSSTLAVTDQSETKGKGKAA